MDIRDEDDEGEDDLGQWQQFVSQRVSENLKHLATLASAGFDFLVILNIQQNAVEDLSPIVTAAKTLRVLNASQNVISQLPSRDFWTQFRNLSLCFLGQNRIRAWNDIEGLQACSRTLVWLTLEANPIMGLANARRFVVNKLPFLQALNEYVVTDLEFLRNHGFSSRFQPEALRLHLGQLQMPLEFVDDTQAISYLKRTETVLTHLYGRNSPSITLQRVIRGFLSQCLMFPRLSKVRKLVVLAQKRIRGFLFRQMIKRTFIELVHAQGKQQLLLGFGSSDVLPTGARRGLLKLLELVQAWKVRFHLKKQAIAISKIRFWCQMVHQRYVYKTKLLLRRENEIFIYYTQPFEENLLDLALRAAHRDPYLMNMPLEERVAMLRQRCVNSGTSVLRMPKVTEHERPCSPKEEIEQHRKLASTAVVRVFPSDFALETQLLVTEKKMLIQELHQIMTIRKKHQLSHSTRDLQFRQPRAVIVHVNQMFYELEKRLVICNKKIMHTCIKLQAWKTRPNAKYSLATVPIRTRGHAPTAWERKKFKSLTQSKQGMAAKYLKMRAFIPWSIDMYLQIVAVLERFSSSHSPVLGFAIAYDEARSINAALSIQSTWRATQRQSKRESLEVAISRARLCIQRWWRFRCGLRRRMDFLKSCLLLGATINSSTLFMEEFVYRTLTNAKSWRTVRANQRPCKEHSIHCLMAEGSVEIAVTASQSAFRTSTTGKQLRHQHSSISYSKMELWSSQRCGYFPAWMPETPEHIEESMSARDEDATPLLLTERVQAEPTLLERELILGGTETTGDLFMSTNPFRGFADCKNVSKAATNTMELVRSLSRHRKRAWQTQSPLLSLESTSFVRLTFSSVEEARKRAIVLLAKTYDPITRSYARLYSIETLFGAALFHHQWALTQVLGVDESEALAKEYRQWLRTDFPSKWWVYMERKCRGAIPLDPKAASTASLRHVAPSESGMSPPRYHRHENSTPPSPRLSPKHSHSECLSPTPLHLVVPGLPVDSDPTVAPSIQPRPPSSSSAQCQGSRGSSRHQIFIDRLGKAECSSVDLQTVRDAREFFVRDLREERERAMEALIVDRRMIQRERAAEVAGIALDIDVKLQRLRYERELAKINTREWVESEKMASKCVKLTQTFQQTFASQTGALMRVAARKTVDRRLEEREETRKERATLLRQRDLDSLERRQDAKSYMFVQNQKLKRDLNAKNQTDLGTVKQARQERSVKVRQRVKEDKEIKNLLRLI